MVHRLDLLQGGCAEHLQRVAQPTRRQRVPPRPQRALAMPLPARSTHRAPQPHQPAPFTPPHARVRARARAHLDDFDELVHAGLAREEGHPEEQLGEHAPHRPDVDAARVVRGAKYQLGGPIVAGANVGHVRLALDQDLGAAKVAELEQVRLRVDKQVLRLDVAMAHAERMDVRQRAAELVSVQLRTQGHVAVRRANGRHLGPPGSGLGAPNLHVQQREGLLGFRVVPRHAVHRLRDEVHHEVQVGLVRLRCAKGAGAKRPGTRRGAGGARVRARGRAAKAERSSGSVRGPQFAFTPSV